MFSLSVCMFTEVMDQYVTIGFPTKPLPLIPRQISVWKGFQVRKRAESYLYRSTRTHVPEYDNLGRPPRGYSLLANGSTFANTRNCHKTKRFSTFQVHRVVSFVNSQRKTGRM